MNVWAFVAALAGGAAIGTQGLLNGALGRSRGVVDAIFVSITVSFGAIVVLLAVQAARGVPFGLPFTRLSSLLVGVGLLLLTLALALVGQGIPLVFFGAGVLGVVVLLATAFATPRLGVGLTAAALTAGQLGAGVFWDQVGPLGLRAIPISPMRVAGLLLIIGGVVLVRGLG